MIRTRKRPGRTTPEAELSISVPFLGSFAVQAGSLGVVLWHASAFEAGFLSNCLGESVSFRGEFRPPNSKVVVDNETLAQERNFRLGDGFHRLICQSNSFALLLRYQAQAERQYRRAIAEFDRLKALREESRNEANSTETETNETTSPPCATNPIPPGDPAPPPAPGPQSDFNHHQPVENMDMSCPDLPQLDVKCNMI